MEGRMKLRLARERKRKYEKYLEERRKEDG